MASPNEIKKNVVIQDAQGLWVVSEFQHVNPGKGSSFVRTRMKNIQSGKVLERTFKSAETIDLVAVDHRRMQFLYKDQSGYAFMDNENYEQTTMSEEDVGEQGKYLREGLEVHITVYEGKPLAVELPKKMVFKVTEAPEVVVGNTASGGNMTKEVTLEGDLKIRAPMFIKAGEEIVVNTETGEYVERAK